jgi:hypothetical protein
MDVREQQPTLFELDRVDRIAYDELNLVEIPFTLPRTTPNRRTADLSPDGTCYLATSGDSLPTAIAQRVVLALLWMTREENGFEDPHVHFKLSQLTRFMYPHRQYAPNGRTLAAIHRELYRIAATRIHHDRWYDRAAGRHIKVNAALFDQLIEVRPELRLGTPFKIRWGSFIYDSVRAQYTKPLDIRTWLAIEKPLDLTLYRWLDRQLARKDEQVVASCQNFARYKLLLQSRRLEMGGRSASAYALDRVADSLSRLNGLGVAVRLEVDRRPKDFRFTFRRIAAQTNELVINEPERGKGRSVRPSGPANDVVVRFQRQFHGLPATAEPPPPRDADLSTAREWLKKYPLAELLELIVIAADLHRRTQSGEQILWLKGVGRYLDAAVAERSRRQGDRDRDRDRAEVEALWPRYVDALARRTPLDEGALLDRATVRADQDLPAGRLAYPTIRDNMITGLVHELRLETLGAMPREDFHGSPDVAALRTRLSDFHGFDVLESAK